MRRRSFPILEPLHCLSSYAMIEHHLVIRIGNEYEAVKIVTNYLRTPNAVPELDWMAYSQNWQTGDPAGHGATEQEAIHELRKELEFRVHTPMTGEPYGED